jgi:hypothetical protein
MTTDTSQSAVWLDFDLDSALSEVVAHTVPEE